MSKSALLFSLLFFVFLSGTAQQGQREYYLYGKLSGLEDGTKIILSDPYQFDGTFKTDTAILLNGEYFFKGINSYPQEAAITYLNSAENFIFWLDTGTIFIQSHRGNVRKSTYTGSPIPALIDKYVLGIQRYNDTLNMISYKLRGAIDSAEATLLSAKRTRYQDSILQCAIKVIEDNPQSYYSVITLARIRYQLPLEKYVKLFDTVNKYWAGSYGVDLLIQFNNVRKALKTGEVIWDFPMIGEDGLSVKLSEFKGRYIYLDFWASHCAPCLKKMPYLDSLQKRADSSKFVIVTLSLDNVPAKWKGSITRNNVCFKNFIMPSDDEMIRNKFIDVFGLQYIPRVFLLAPDLSLISVDPTEKSLEDYLKETGSLLW